MSLNQVTAKAIEKLVNKLLSLDAEAAKQIKPLESKSILIQLEDWQLNYLFCFKNASVEVSQPSNEEAVTENKQSNEQVNQPSATITGKLSAFIAAALAEQSGDAVFQGDLHFSGDINTAKQFQQLASKLEIDWQEPFAKIFGDFLGHTITSGLSLFGNWANQVKNSLQQDISEYVQEEAKITPSDSEQQMFFDEVDLVRSQADRLLAKVEKMIEAKLLNSGNK
jgi:ubiquinone biosynthesis protein UbiJ